MSARHDGRSATLKIHKERKGRTDSKIVSNYSLAVDLAEGYVEVNSNQDPLSLQISEIINGGKLHLGVNADDRREVNQTV